MLIVNGMIGRLGPLVTLGLLRKHERDQSRSHLCMGEIVMGLQTNSKNAPVHADPTLSTIACGRHGLLGAHAPRLAAPKVE